MYLCQTTYYDVWCFGKTLFLIVSPSKDGRVLMALRNGPGEFGPVTIRPSGIFGEFGILIGECGPQVALINQHNKI